MTIVAKGKLSKVYVEIDERFGRISRVLMCLDGQWIEFTEVGTGASEEFTLPAPLGCECIVTDISDQQWEDKKYEVEYASSYSRDGVFWAKEFHKVDGFSIVVQR